MIRRYLGILAAVGAVSSYAALANSLTVSMSHEACSARELSFFGEGYKYDCATRIRYTKTILVGETLDTILHKFEAEVGEKDFSERQFLKQNREALSCADHPKKGKLEYCLKPTKELSYTVPKK